MTSPRPATQTSRTLPCGCVRNVSPCPAAVTLWEAVADAHHEWTEARRNQEEQRIPFYTKRHTPKEREHNDALAQAAAVASNAYIRAMDAYVEHYAVEEDPGEQASLLESSL